MLAIRRERSRLPGSDPLGMHVSLGLFYLVASMLLFIVSEWYLPAQLPSKAQGGHLPWPLAQWALMTPLGTLTVTIAGGLLMGLPAGWGMALFWLGQSRPVDVTDLAPADRALYARPPRRRPSGPTRAEFWLGRGSRQRVLSSLALAAAAMLILSGCAGVVAVFRYGATHFPQCVGPGGLRCPPAFVPTALLPFSLGIATQMLCACAAIRYIEWRCGVRFRIVSGTQVPFGCYLRQPGVSAERASAALARYTGPSDQPFARRTLQIVPFFLPLFLVMIALFGTAAWLPTQWIFT